MDFWKPIAELALQKIKLFLAQHLHLVPPRWLPPFCPQYSQFLHKENISIWLQET